MSRPHLQIISLQAYTASIGTTSNVQALYGLTYSTLHCRGNGTFSLSCFGAQTVSPILLGTASWSVTSTFATISVGDPAAAAFGGLNYLVGTGNYVYDVDYFQFGATSSGYTVNF